MQTRIFRPTPTNLRRMAALLKRGELVAVPSETVYGLAADATNPIACRKVFKAKNRPKDDPLIVHIHALYQAKALTHWNSSAALLAKAFWPGPLTMVLPKTEIISDEITAGMASVAIRMPAHAVFRKLLKITDLPLAAPSANSFGYISPTTSNHVWEGLKGAIPAILEGGNSNIGLESTIIDLRQNDSPVILRPGAISADKIAYALNLDLAYATSSPSSVAPGLQKRHYSPLTPVVLHRQFPKGKAESKNAWVHFAKPTISEPVPQNHYIMAPDGEGATAAKRLFALLRQLDAKGYQCINIQTVPHSDPWAPAINDRLQRASAR